MTGVWLTAPQFTEQIEPVLAARSFCERADLGLMLFDHLVPLGDPRRPVLELSTTLGMLAGSTQRLRLGTLVLRAPLRGVEVSTAIGATLAAVAPGRVVVGLGAGDRLSAEEADRFGLATAGLEARVAQVAETAERLRSSGVPVWIGGLHPRILELAAVSDGWNGWAITAERLDPIARRLRAEAPGVKVTWGGAVMVGRDAADIEELVRRRGGADGLVVGDPEAVAVELARRIESGADELIVSVLPNVLERWDLFAETVLPRLG